MIKSDNSSVFKNLRVNECPEKEAIKHDFSAPYTPQQNSVVARKNKMLIDMARMILGQYNTPDRFWVKVVNTTCNAINWLYLHRLLKKAAYELLPVTNPMYLTFVYLGIFLLR